MPSTRRDFLRQAGAVAVAGAASTTLTPDARGAGANDRFTVGFIACGGQAKGLMHALSSHKDVDVAWLCDTDSKRLDDAKQLIAESFANAKTPQTTGDLRKVLDDKSVDAVFIATPDHWHAPATLLALAAGKHVYVEKPCGHNPREGELIVQAQQKSHRVVQMGTQQRSYDLSREIIQGIHECVGCVLAAASSERRTDRDAASVPGQPAGGAKCQTRRDRASAGPEGSRAGDRRRHHREVSNHHPGAAGEGRDPQGAAR